MDHKKEREEKKQEKKKENPGRWADSAGGRRVKNRTTETRSVFVA